MRGDNPILALKLHILLHILMKSICISFKPLQPTFIWRDDQNEGWQPYTSIKTIQFASYLDEIWYVSPSNLYNPLSFDETIKMRGNNPILALKLHILLHILMKLICISFKPLQPTVIWWDDQNEGWQPYTSIKTTHFASYLDEIYMYLLQTFTTHFHLTRQSKWGVTTLY